MPSTGSSNYEPQGKPKPVVGRGDFIFAVMYMDHAYIYMMCKELIEAGATLKWVYDPDSARVGKFLEAFPDAKVASHEDEILRDAEVQLVASTTIPNLRAALGVKVMECGKDFITDKPPFTALDQLYLAKDAALKTGKKFAITYSERIHNESAVFAGQLIQDGAIGRVVQVLGVGSHLINNFPRPDWFFTREQNGGVLCDLATHQIDSFLYYAGCKDARVVRSNVANYHNKQYPELDDYGDATLIGDNGATSYFRVDWLSPKSLQTWGDLRTFIQGTDGYIELRKNVDVARSREGNQLYLVDSQGERHLELQGKVGYPYFGQLILDCLNRTENAMTQEHAFKAAELTLLTQKYAVHLE